MLKCLCTIVAFLSAFIGWSAGAQPINIFPKPILQDAFNGPIQRVDFSPDGRWLFVRGSTSGVPFISADSRIAVWDMAVYRKSETLDAVELSADGRWEVLAPERNRTDNPDQALGSKVELFDRTTGKSAFDLSYRGNPNFGTASYIHKPTVSPDGRFVAAAGPGLIVWTVASGKAIDVGPEGEHVSDLAISGNSERIATIGAVRGIEAIRIYTSESMIAPVITLPSGKQNFVKVLLSPDGGLIAAVDKNGMVLIWDLAEAKQNAAPSPMFQLQSHNPTLNFSPNSRYLAIIGDGLIQDERLVDLREKRIVMQPWLTRRTNLVAFAPDSSKAAFGGDDGFVVLVDLAQHAVIRWISLDSTFDRAEAVGAMAFAPDGKTLAVGEISGRVLVFQAASGAAVTSLGRSVVNFTTPRYTAGGRLLEIGALSLGLTGRDRSYLDLAYGRIYCPTNSRLSPDGNRIALGGSTQIVVKEVWTGVVIREFRANAGNDSGFPGRPICFSADGKKLLTVSIVGFVLFDVESGATITTIPFANPSDALMSPQDAFLSPDGLYICFLKSIRTRLMIHNSVTGTERQIVVNANLLCVSAGGSRVCVVEGEPGKAPANFLVYNLSDAGPPVKIPLSNIDQVPVFSQDGLSLATETNEGEVDVWNTSSGARVAHLSRIGGASNLNAQVSPAVFNKSGDQLLVSAKDASGRVWDIKTGRISCSLPTGAVKWNAGAFSEDSRRLATVGTDGALRTWDSAGKLLATTVAFDDSGAITFAPDGYYFAEHNAADGVVFRLGQDLYTFDEFDAQYNRPDIVLHALGAASKEVLAMFAKAVGYRRRLLGLPDTSRSKEPVDLRAVPSLLGSVRDLPPVTKQLVISVRIRATCKQEPIDHIRISVNGTPLFGRQGKRIGVTPSRAIDQMIRVPLTPGLNRLTMSVSSAGIESARQIASIQCARNARSASKRPDLYMISFGVSKYKNAAFDLNYAAKDAHDLAALFERMRSRYGAVHIQVFTNEEVTREALTKASALLSKAKPEDFAILFFAGHGMLDEKNNYYFGAADIEFAHPAVRGISFDSMVKLLQGSAARSRLLLVDTCHAGEPDRSVEAGFAPTVAASPYKSVVTRTLARGPVLAAARTNGIKINAFDLLRSQFVDLRDVSGITVIAASGGGESALEEGGNGVFTAVIMAGLLNDRADLNGDGTVTADELQEFTSMAVDQLTAGRQRPETRVSNRDAPFRFPASSALLWSGPAQFLETPSLASFAFTKERELAYTDDLGAIIVRNLDSGDIISRLALAQAINAPTHRFLAYEYRKGGLIRDADSGDVTMTLPDIAFEGQSSAYSPDGKLVAGGTKTEDVRIWDTSTGKGFTIAPKAGFITYAAFTPKADALIVRFVNRWAKFALSRMPDGSIIGDRVMDPLLSQLGNTPPCYSNDGEFAAVQYVPGEIEIHKLAGKAPVTVLKHEQGYAQSDLGILALSPNGRMLASADPDAAVRIWDLSTGKLLTVFRGCRGGAIRLAFSPDGGAIALASANGMLQLWSVSALAAAPTE